MIYLSIYRGFTVLKLCIGGGLIINFVEESLINLLYHQLTFKVNRKFSLFTTSFYFKCNNNTSIKTFYFSIPCFPNKEPVFSGVNTGSLLSFSINFMSCKFL